MAAEPNKQVNDQELNGTGLFEAYRRMLACYFLSTIALAAIIVIPAVVLDALNKALNSGNRYEFPILAFIALSGALGAFFSALMRLYKLEELPAALLRPDFRHLRNRYLVMYSLIPPITGMIGAVVFYLVIAAGLIKGDAFQEFKCFAPNNECNSFAGFLFYAPAAAQDYAKSLVWGFISGFSERLVPDALGRMGKNGRGS